MEEILRMDPQFDIDKFLLHTEKATIPAVMEAYYSGDLAVLKDWCSEMRSSVYEQEFADRERQGLVIEAQIMDLDDVNLLQCQQMDEYPMLMISFATVQNVVVRNKVGEITEGAEDEVNKALWVIALRRDPNELDPLLAWEMIDLQQHVSQKYY
jgi:predicted lipid-binding transport protein (Tim44 family)